MSTEEGASAPPRTRVFCRGQRDDPSLFTMMRRRTVDPECLTSRLVLWKMSDRVVLIVPNSEESSAKGIAANFAR